MNRIVQLRARFGISDRLDELNKNLSEMADAKRKGESEVELNIKTRYVTPLAILPLAMCANRCDVNIRCTEDSNHEARRYLRVIGFPSGVTNLQISEANHLPITKLPADEYNQTLREYEGRIISRANLVEAEAARIKQFKLSLNTLTSELVSNVLEHAIVRHYRVLAQYYGGSSNKMCEIVIADTGVGYKQSYEGTQFEVESDAAAIQNAIEGKSSKSRIDDAWDRGGGIPIIANLFVDRFDGKLIFMSGKSILYYKGDTTNAEKEIELPFTLEGSTVCINFNVSSV